MEELTPEYLLKTISNVIGNSSYQEHLEQHTEIHHYSKHNPLDNSVFWIEHVMAYKVTKFTKPLEKHVSWYEYLFLDTVTITLIYLYVTLHVCKKLRYYMEFEETIPKNPRHQIIKKKRKQVQLKQE
jgi:hypothetical protein